MAPSWIVRKFYPDNRLSKEIEIRTTLSHEGPTLRLETWFEMPRLVLNFVLQNTSLYRDVRVDRLIVSINDSINDGLDLTYEGWAAESPPTRIQIIALLTSAQAAWLKNISGALQLKVTAKLVCDERTLKKKFHLTEKLNVTS